MSVTRARLVALGQSENEAKSKAGESNLPSSRKQLRSWLHDPSSRHRSLATRSIQLRGCMYANELHRKGYRLGAVLARGAEGVVQAAERHFVSDDGRSGPDLGSSAISGRRHWVHLESLNVF